MVWDPGFENAGTLAGDADGWVITVTDSNWGWARYGVKDWGIERYETDWSNDNYIFFFAPGDLEFAEFDPDSKEYEPYVYWGAGGSLLTYFEDWTAITDEAAEFDTTPEDFEDFEEDWNNSPFYPAFSSFIFGEGEAPYLISEGRNKLGLKLEHPVNPDFDAVIEITAGSYTALNLAIELVGKINAALTAAGGAFGPGDILFGIAPPDFEALVVANNKSGYVLRLYADAEDGWPVVLGRELTWWDYRYLEADLLNGAVFPWVGEYNSDNWEFESFERDWLNSENVLPWEFRSTFVDFIDGTVETPSGDWVVVLGVNDQAGIRVREWKTINGGSTTLVIPAGTYTLAQLVVQIQIVLDAWLVGLGAPFGAGDIKAQASPNNTVRLLNDTGNSDKVFWILDNVISFWPYVGMQMDDVGRQVEEYYQPDTARFPGLHELDPAMFDAAPEAYEDFEEDWP